MKNIRGVLFFLLITVATIGSIFLSCASHKDILRRQLARNPIRSIDYWGKEWSKKPLSQRIGPASKELVEYLRMDNELFDVSEKPVGAEPTPEYFEAFRAIESQLPASVIQLAEERFIGIFVVNDLGTSGYTEAIADKAGEEKYAIIVLDTGVLLSRRANEWATWKENSIFEPTDTSGERLTLVIESEENNTVVNAIRYILLHELGHALGLISNAHPSWLPSGKPMKVDHPFTKISWKLTEKSKIVSLFEDEFPERKSIRYYAFEKAALSGDQIIDVYAKLQRHTGFSSMQAAVDMWEDFAESFVTYVHVVCEKRPWQIRIERENEPAVTIESCWYEGRCNEKEAFMEKWFKNPLQTQ